MGLKNVIFRLTSVSLEVSIRGATLLSLDLIFLASDNCYSGFGANVPTTLIIRIKLGPVSLHFFLDPYIIIT